MDRKEVSRLIEVALKIYQSPGTVRDSDGLRKDWREIVETLFAEFNKPLPKLSDEKRERLARLARTAFIGKNGWATCRVCNQEDYRLIAEALYNDIRKSPTVEDVRAMLPERSGFMVFNDGDGYVRRDCDGPWLTEWDEPSGMIPAIKGLAPKHTNEEDKKEVLTWAKQAMRRSSSAFAAMERIKAREETNET